MQRRVSADDMSFGDLNSLHMSKWFNDAHTSVAKSAAPRPILPASYEFRCGVSDNINECTKLAYGLSASISVRPPTEEMRYANAIVRGVRATLHPQKLFEVSPYITLYISSPEGSTFISEDGVAKTEVFHKSQKFPYIYDSKTCNLHGELTQSSLKSEDGTAISLYGEWTIDAADLCAHEQMGLEKCRKLETINLEFDVEFTEVTKMPQTGLIDDGTRQWPTRSFTTFSSLSFIHF